MTDVDETATPPIELLVFLRKHAKDSPNHIPYVELSSLCLPEWST